MVDNVDPFPCWGRAKGFLVAKVQKFQILLCGHDKWEGGFLSQILWGGSQASIYFLCSNYAFFKFWSIDILQA